MRAESVKERFLGGVDRTAGERGRTVEVNEQCNCFHTVVGNVKTLSTPRAYPSRKFSQKRDQASKKLTGNEPA
jgi:hypothetical protein